MVAQLQAALDRIWGSEDKPLPEAMWRFALRRLLSLGFVGGLAFLLVVSLILSAMGHALAVPVLALLPAGADAWVWLVAETLLSWLAFGGMFLLVYRVMPEATVRLRHASVGAAVTSTLFVVGKELLGRYLGTGAVGTAYGAAGSLAILLTWVYYSSAILLFGAHLTHCLAMPGAQGGTSAEGQALP